MGGFYQFLFVGQVRVREDGSGRGEGYQGSTLNNQQLTMVWAVGVPVSVALHLLSSGIVRYAHDGCAMHRGSCNKLQTTHHICNRTMSNWHRVTNLTSHSSSHYSCHWASNS